MQGYDEAVVKCFLKNQGQLFPEPVAETYDEAEAFLDTLSPNGKKNRLWNIKLKYVQDMLDDVTDKIRKH